MFMFLNSNRVDVDSRVTQTLSPTPDPSMHVCCCKFTALISTYISLTFSSPVVSNGYTIKCSGPYWSNPPFRFFDIRVLWRSGLSARVPEFQKIIKGGSAQYGAEHFGRLIFTTIRKNCEIKRIKQ